MKYLTLDKVDRKILKIGKSNLTLFDLVEKQLKMFENDEKHPSLRVHKLKGKLKNFWSLSIGMGIRMIYYVEDGKAFFVDIGTHEEVYKTN